MATLGLCVLALNICLCFSKITFESDGYHLVVGIHRDVPENTEIIDQLQVALTSASNYLHRTSRYMLNIGKVTILVPETWGSKPEWKSSTLIFKDSTIRVDSSRHPSMGDNPYTFQPGLCGDEGRYIHLTPDFVLENGMDRDFYYGDFGRLLVHEFAHLRFGVFDEYGDMGSRQHPVGYVNNTKLEPTACSKDIKGTFLNMKTDKACILSDENRLSDDCAFIVNSFESKATSSVMFAQYVEEIEDFCETNAKDAKLKHNADAPNTHNKMCNGRGTWDIIEEHDDIVYSPANEGALTAPIFEVVQSKIEMVNDTRICGHRLVFVLDLSGSMKDNNRYFKLRQMADKIIRDILPDGTEVGIVVFSTRARVWAEMRYLTSEADRQTLADGLPEFEDFEGLTAMGQGLLRAVDLLEKNGKSAKEGRIFLLTDGQENIFPYVMSHLSEYGKKGVVVHTLAYSENASAVLEKLQALTGGTFHYYDEGNNSTVMNSLQHIQEDLSMCDDNDKRVEIDRYAVVLDSTTTSFERNITIDITIGNNTLFVFTLSLGATTKVSLKDPDGAEYDDTSSKYIYAKDSKLNIIRFRFPEAKQGTWTYTLRRGSANETVVCVVTSHQRNDFMLPYEAESWLGKTSLNIKKEKGLGIFSYVHQGYGPIINAVVKVVISGSIVKEIPLEDDGKFPDNAMNDGVYTGFVTGFRSNSRHSLEVTVTSNGSTAVIREGSSSSARAPVIYPNRTEPVVLEPVDPFTRTSSAGAVDVEGFVPNVDQIDPGRVTDLEVIISDRDTRHVTLTWTAPGDDLYEGTVDRYDIRIAESFEHLRQNFSASYKILESDIKKGDNSPVPAGSQQSMTVSLSGHLDGDSYVFGLKAFDESNRSSDLSNLKAMTFAKIVIPGSPSDTPDEPGESSKQPMLLIIIVASVCFVVLVLVAIVVSCIVCRLCKSSPQPKTKPKYEV